MQEQENRASYRNEELPLDIRVNDLISRLTVEEKISLIPTQQKAIPRLGIPEYSIGGEAAHGVAWIGEATVFPQVIGMAATWDTELMREIGNVIGDEYRVYYQRSNGTKGLSIWFPTVDMERDPRWGRTEEAYGEDPLLTGTMAGALVKALQGSHPFYLRAVATLKHFFANNNERDRVRCSITIDPRNMREYYWEPFRRVIQQGGAKCIMTAYNEVNGIPMIVHPQVQKIVKDEWGLDGFVVCDGADFSQTVNEHHYFKTHAETAAHALKKGVDSLTDEPELVIASVSEALSRGLLAEADLDRALRNIFRIRFRYGQFDRGHKNPYQNTPEAVLCCDAHRKTAYRAAREAVVLLRNEGGFLPLATESIKKIAVIGPMGDELFNDWYSGTYPYKATLLEGLKSRHPDAAVVFVDGSDDIRLKAAAALKTIQPGEDGVLVLTGDTSGRQSIFRKTDWGWGSHTLQSESNGKYVTCDNHLSASADRVFGWFVKEVFNPVPQGGSQYILKTWDGKVAGVDTDGRMVVKDLPGEMDYFELETVRTGIEKAVQAAQQADVVVLALGNNPVINGKEEVDRPDITLPASQQRLMREVFKANPNTVLVLVSSYPVAVPWAQENLPAILHTAHGGQEMGNALADILFGQYSPAGRLPMTWYRSAEQLPPMTDYDIIKGGRTYMYFQGKALYPFGYGLSYTTFEYGGLSVSTPVIKTDFTLSVSVDVTNTGDYDGDEVVQLYIGFVNTRVKRPMKQLKGFRRVHLQRGEQKTVTFTVNARDFSFWDVTREVFCLEKGECRIMIGASCEDIRLSTVVHAEGEVIPPRDLTQKTWAENYDDYYRVFLGEGTEDRSCVCAEGNGSWIAFRQVHLQPEINTIQVRGATATPGAGLEIRLDSPDGRLVAEVFIPNTDTLAVPDWKTVPAWALVEAELKATGGIYDVYMVFKGKASVSWVRMLSPSTLFR